MKKIIKVVSIILIIIVLLLLINDLGILISYKLNKNVSNSFIINGLEEDLVPQGLAVCESKDIILQTSYSSKGDASRIYLTDSKTNTPLKKLDLYLPNGEKNTNHVSGIAICDDKVWISNDYLLEEYDLNEIIDSTDKTVQAKKEFKLKNRGDFCFYKNNILWTGDFYLYPTYKVPGNKPLLLGYTVNKDSNIDFENPTYIIEIPKLIQGMTMDAQNNFVFTKSYSGFRNSKVLIYKNLTDTEKEYKLTNDLLTKEIMIPPMAEGIIYYKYQFHVLFESAAKRYPHAFPKIKNILSVNY